MTALECWQAYTLIFQKFKGSKLSIPPKFKLIQACMVVLVTRRNEEDRVKNEGTRMLTTFLPFNVYRIFFRARAANSAISGQIGLKF